MFENGICNCLWLLTESELLQLSSLFVDYYVRRQNYLECEREAEVCMGNLQNDGFVAVPEQ